MRSLCKLVDMTPQNYYKERKQRQRRQVDEALIVELVCRERAQHWRMGGRKLHLQLAPELAESGVVIGRDRFFEVLRAHDLLIQRRVRCARTTDSRHMFAVYENLLKDLTLTAPHQALLSDITYLRTEEGFLYLCLISDGYSRSIVGYDCSDTLEAEGALRALKKALRQLPAGSGAIHHSDRGSQYCCGDYIQSLKKAGVGISMTQENHCYENAQAERLNGILKQEYGLGGTFATKAQARKAVRQAVWLYNYRRPHQSLGYKIPMTVHTTAA